MIPLVFVMDNWKASNYEDEVYALDKGLPGTRSYRFHVTMDDKYVGCFCFANMPGCCGVVVSHGLLLHAPYRGKRLSYPFQKLREKVARDLGYSAMIATTLADNIPEIRSSSKSGWAIGPEFTNLARTGNKIAFQIKVLNP